MNGQFRPFRETSPLLAKATKATVQVGSSVVNGNANKCRKSTDKAGAERLNVSI